MTTDSASIVGIIGAAVGGAAVGLERERSGHATGPAARLGGIRTFTLLGGLSGIAGWLWTSGRPLPAVVLLVAGAALVVAGYVAASRHEVEGTTEVAALVVLAAGLVAGMGELRLASAIVAVTVLLLAEKSRLHALVDRLDDTGFRAAIRFAVMAVVILPLLPTGPYGPWGGVRPRELWALVLLFSGLSFAGYVARRLAGARRGYPVAGVLGGLVSSTSVTLVFARRSREERREGAALAAGVIAACAVMFARLLVATAILRWDLAVAVVPYVVPPLAVGTLAALGGLRAAAAPPGAIEPPRNPLGFVNALQMVLAFQIVLFAVFVVRTVWGPAGLLATGAIVGLTDVDALAISMTRGAAAEVATSTAARVLAVGALSNTLVKFGLGLAIGRGRFRPLAATGLAAMAAAAGGALAWRW